MISNDITTKSHVHQPQIAIHRMQQTLENMLILKKNKTLKLQKSLNIITWNINECLNVNTNNYPIFVHDIKNTAHIYKFQETIGTKFTGYRAQQENIYGTLLAADKVTNDDYGVTSIYVNKEIISNYIPIYIPPSILDNNSGKSRIYASSMLIISPITNICIINVYRPPLTTIQGMKMHINQLQSVINCIKQFLKDTHTEYMIMGDLNIWHESMGAPARHQADTMYFKYTLGDVVMDHMKQNGFTNIHNGDPTMVKTIKGEQKYFHVDGIWATEQLVERHDINTRFDNDYNHSDHYPGVINIMDIIQIDNKQDRKHIMKHWEIDQIDPESWQQFKYDIDIQMDQILYEINKYKFHPITQSRSFIAKTLSTVNKAIINTAKRTIGETKRGKINEPRINKEISLIIREFRKQKKRIQPILNRIRNLRNKYRKLKFNRRYILSKDIIKQHVGSKQYEEYMAFNQRDKQKKRKIRWAKRQWLQQKANQLVDKINPRNWYNILKQMENKILNKNDKIGRIIKPAVSVQQLNNKERMKLKYTDYTKNDKETAEEIANYMITIGTKENPAYNKQLASSREIARRFDQEFDLKNRNIDQVKYQQELHKLTQKWNLDEIKYALNCCKNNKGYYGDIHILFIKHGGEKLLKILLYIYEWWKNNGSNTNDMNVTLMNIILKPGKQHDVVKGMRPTQMAHPIFKIYAFMVLRRTEQYEAELKILSNDQYAAKKGSGSEDCLIAMIHDWNTMRHKEQSTAAVTFDSGDAFDCMQPQIIHDKLMHHMGFNMKAITMFQSIEYNCKVIVKINNTHTDKKQVQSSTHYQGFPLSQLIWCIYINPLMMKMKKQQKITNNKNNIIAQVCIRSLMDDITIYTKISDWYYKKDRRDVYQKIIDRMNKKKEGRKYLNKYRKIR